MLIGLGIVALGVFLGAIFWIAGSVGQHRAWASRARELETQLQPLQEHVWELRRRFGDIAINGPIAAPSPVLRGKLVLVEREENGFTHLADVDITEHFAFREREDLFARTLGAAQTLVWVETSTQKTGRMWQDNVPQGYWVRTVTLIDLERETVVDRKRFDGTPVNAVRPSIHSDRMGSKPLEEIVDYLLNLPVVE